MLYQIISQCFGGQYTLATLKPVHHTMPPTCKSDTEQAEPLTATRSWLLALAQRSRSILA